MHTSAQAKYETKQLLGKWELGEVPPRVKAIIEFQNDNKIEINVDFQGNQQKRIGTYQLKGETLTLTFRRDGNDKEQKCRILKLNDKEFIFRDEEKGEEQVLKKLP